MASSGTQYHLRYPYMGLNKTRGRIDAALRRAWAGSLYLTKG